MASWDQLKARTDTITEQLKTKKDQYRSKDFAIASMAMCALISAADGSIDASERQKTAALIARNDVLAVFPPEQLRQQFDAYCDKLNRDFDFGKVAAITAIAAIAAIGRLRAKPEQARAVIAVSLIIGGADGTFDTDERKAVTEACHAVGIHRPSSISDSLPLLPAGRAHVDGMRPATNQKGPVPCQSPSPKAVTSH